MVYRCLWVMVMPLVLLRLWWRGRRQPAYRQQWRERLGCVDVTAPVDVWWHAVSVGEVVASVPTLKALQARFPALRVWVTVSTPTGRQTVQDRLPDLTCFSYAPMDQTGCVQRFLKRIQPSLIVVMETEVWPEWLCQAERRGIPVVLANARLSEKSCRGYARLGWFTRKVLQRFATVGAQSPADAERFVRLGCDAACVSVMGNLKFDMPAPVEAREKGLALRDAWGARLVWLAASTHLGEDELVLAAHAEILKHLPDSLLVLVPRHADRFDAVAQLVERSAFHLVRRSHQGTVVAETQVYLGDTMGELLVFMSACSVVFVGGSLIPHGGHNLLEPVLCGAPVLTGPYTHNFMHIHHLLETQGAIRTVHSSTQLARSVLDLWASDETRRQLVSAGKQVLLENQGATERLLRLIRDYLHLRDHLHRVPTGLNP
ncbi:MAG: lipid IV(A) 3-deoxy-D-manno-octulosonic acid transferase [Gammaproteobacteria bacterium]